MADGGIEAAAIVAGLGRRSFLDIEGSPAPLPYRVDFICWDEIIVEVKAADALSAIDYAQVLNYRRASGCRRGLLLNFGGRSLEHRRVVWGYERGGAGPVGTGNDGGQDSSRKP